MIGNKLSRPWAIHCILHHMALSLAARMQYSYIARIMISNQCLCWQSSQGNIESVGSQGFAALVSRGNADGLHQ